VGDDIEGIQRKGAAMLKEIRRVGLVSAGAVCGALSGALVLVLGTVGIVGVALAGDVVALAAFTRFDTGAAMAPPEAASVLAVMAVVWLLIGTTGALVGGFLLGLFLAASYNVVAGVTGGVLLELGTRHRDAPAELSAAHAPAPQRGRPPANPAADEPRAK
jgi:hypothetical protein